MKEILLNKGMATQVDNWNYNRLNQKKWYAKKDRNTYYVYRKEKGHQIAMHREILKTPTGVLVNHKDWNGLNNQEYNITNCTNSVNSQYVKPRSNTGYLGVSRHIKHNADGTIYIHYTSSIKCNGVIHRLGCHKTPESGAVAYDKKAKELFGEFANLNFKSTQL